MHNIYDIFKDEEELALDKEYYGIQESLDTLLEEPVIVTLEELVYNNPEKKKLSVLIEEVEAAKEKNKMDIVEKLKAQMQRVLNWIMNIFKHYDKAFQEGASFVKSNDLNQCMIKIKQRHINVLVTWHPNRPSFQKIQTICMRDINMDKTVMNLTGANHQHLRTVRKSSKIGGAAEQELASGDKTEDYFQGMLRQFKLDKANLKETNLTAVNVLVIHNNLVAMPEANRKLQQVKSKVQRMYNLAINRARNDANGSEARGIKADNKLSDINAQMKGINEAIRAYAKLMKMVFNEDYNLAKLIVTKANGKEYNVNTSEKPKQEQPQPQQKPQEKKETKKRWFNKPI